MAAIYLKPLDDAMAKLPINYTRFMDDWVIVAKTRSKLCKAIRIMNQTLTKLKLKKHPDKTSMGRTAKGFDFLGYHLQKDQLRLARKTIQQFQSNMTRLYKQGATASRLVKYWKH